VKKQIIILLLIGFLFPLAQTAFALPVINEFYSAESSDWIEIYNPGPETVDLSVYKIRDSSENNKIDLSGNLSAGGFAVFEWSNKLNNGGDQIKIHLSSDESVIDQTSFGDSGGIIAPAKGQTAGRKSDGGNEWVLFTAHSKGLSNNSVSIFTPATPSPTKTPTPTRTPTSTKTPTATKTNAAFSKTPNPSTTPVVGGSSTGQGNSSVKSVKIATVKKTSSEFAKIEPITNTEDKSEVKVLGAKDSSYSPFILISGIVFLASGGIIFGRKYFKERELL
jgi:hypothetical protein